MNPTASLPGGRVLAVPSWVRPGSLAENCRWLSGKVDEIGLLFFESRPCLAYSAEDLPPQLAALPLGWHLHLPTDLDWSNPARSAKICLDLLEKVSFLGVRRAVLHPPKDETSGPGPLPGLTGLLRAWNGAGLDSRDLLLENQPEDDLFLLVALAEYLSCSLCLDLGHLLCRAPEAPSSLDTERICELLGRVRLLHLCAPGPLRADGSRSCHAPLDLLSPAERALARRICRRAPRGTVFMLELFSWEAIERSLPLLHEWLQP